MAGFTYSTAVLSGPVSEEIGSPAPRGDRGMVSASALCRGTFWPGPQADVPPAVPKPAPPRTQGEDNSLETRRAEVRESGLARRWQRSKARAANLQAARGGRHGAMLVTERRCSNPF